MPTSHQYQEEKMNPDRLRSWAKGIGEQSVLFVEDAFNQVEHLPNAYRKIVAVLSFAKIYGKVDLELALQYALNNKITATKSIRSILEKKLYLGQSLNNTTHKAKTSLFNDHENIRGASEYQ
jgi:hypothetical protein